MTRSALDCRVLGPLQVDVDGVEVSVAGQVAGRVLAALSTTAGSPMHDDLLADVVWGNELPTRTAHALRVAVCRLRSKLGQDSVLRTPGGYALSASADQVDHHRFVESVNEGLRCSPESAISYFESALNLWRGSPWPELREADLITRARQRLEELRLVATEELQAARLATGDFRTALAALRVAVVETPYRERRWELLATALYAAGEQTQARAELRRVRQILADDLGIDPSPALQALEHRFQIPEQRVHQPSRRPVAACRWRHRW